MTEHRQYYLKNIEGRVTPQTIDHINKQFAKHVLLALSKGEKPRLGKFGISLRGEDLQLYDTVGEIAELCIMTETSTEVNDGTST